MKDHEQIDELLNSYLDDELDDRKINELKRLVDHDSAIREKLESLSKARTLLRSVPAEAAPEGMLENITHQLERQVLLDDTADYSYKAGKRHLLLRRIMTAAAVLVLISALSVIVFDIFVPKSSRDQIFAGLAKKEPKTEILYERPFADIQTVEYKKVTSQYSSRVPLAAKLVFDTSAPIEADTFVGKAIMNRQLFAYVSLIDRRAGSISYVIDCDRPDLINLIQDMKFLWQSSKYVTLKVGTDNFGRYITLDNTTASQAVEIFAADNYSQRIRMAKDLAVINQLQPNNPLKSYAKISDIDYNLLIPDKPVLTSPQGSGKSQAKSTLIDPANLTIVIVNK